VGPRLDDIRAAAEAAAGEMTDLVRRLVAMESPTQDKRRVDAVIDVLEAAYRDLGFSCRRLIEAAYGDHLIADSPGPETPRVLLVGHADTVHAAGTIDTMSLRLDHDRLFGPGVVDMKGGLVVMLYAVRCLLAHGPRLAGSIRVVVNSDEEPGSPASRRQWPALARGAAAALVFEPGRPGGTLVLRRKGVGIFRLRVKGRAAHAGAEPDKGASAIRALARKCLDIEALAAPEAGTTVNVGVIAGGTHPYVIPAEAEAAIDARVATAAEAERLLSGMKAIASRADVPGTAAALEGEFHRPPLEPGPGMAELVAVVEDVGRELDTPIRWTSTGGASDGNNIAATGVPTIDAMGPEGGGAHSAEEYLDIPSLAAKTALAAGVLARLLGAAHS
jgi:glutamate carboxypeptidase